MVCQRCKQNTATVHLTEVVKNEKRERHLCERCAAEEGVTVKPHVPLNELLTNFVMAQSGMQEVAELTCDDCGMTFIEFRSQGLLGCARCYDAFEKALDPLIERAHEGATHHVGKVPAGVAASHDRREHELRGLHRRLEAAVQSESYEEAAKLRDQIRALEEAS